VAYGYRLADGVLPQLANPTNISIKLNKKMPIFIDRQPMMVSMGCVVVQAAMPHPDQKCSYTMLGGVIKRIAAKLPEPEVALLSELKIFVRGWLKKHMRPLHDADDLTFETWIENKKYPDWRKAELKKVYSEIKHKDVNAKMSKVKCFMKDENYMSYKHARGIYARADTFKVLFGPMVSAIEDRVYAHPFFIKHIPVADRPAYIKEMFNMIGKPMESDFESFESSFRKIIMESIDFELFNFFCEFLSDSFYRELYERLGEENLCEFIHFYLSIESRRMSGEMCTSLCNGFANLMILLFLHEKLGLPEPKALIEGDDGLTMNSSGKYPVKEDFERLGFKAKLEVRESISEASFCGLIYDEEDLINIADPRKILMNIGWASQRYVDAKHFRLMALLRCKGLSFLHQYPGCPIIQELAIYILRVTRSVDAKSFVNRDRMLTAWERERYMNMSFKAPDVVRAVPERTRMLMERHFNVTIEEQIRIETYLKNLDKLQPLSVDLDFPVECIHYMVHYVARNGDSPINYTTGMESVLKVLRRRGDILRS